MPTNATMTHPIEQQEKTDMTMNNSCSNLNGSSMYDRWIKSDSVVKPTRVNLITRDSDMVTTIRDRRRNCDLGWNEKAETKTNNITPNLTIIMPTYIKLARMKPRRNRSENLKRG